MINTIAFQPFALHAHEGRPARPGDSQFQDTFSEAERLVEQADLPSVGVCVERGAVRCQREGPPLESCL